jgi:hypothetical protein
MTQASTNFSPKNVPTVFVVPAKLPEPPKFDLAPAVINAVDKLRLVLIVLSITTFLVIFVAQTSWFRVIRGLFFPNL